MAAVNVANDSYPCSTSPIILHLLLRSLTVLPHLTVGVLIGLYPHVLLVLKGLAQTGPLFLFLIIRLLLSLLGQLQSRIQQQPNCRQTHNHIIQVSIVLDHWLVLCLVVLRPALSLIHFTLG